MATTAPPRRWRTSRSLVQKIREKLIEWALLGCGLLSIAITLFIGLILLHNAVSFFLYDDIDFDEIAAVSFDAQAVAGLAPSLAGPFAVPPGLLTTLDQSSANKKFAALQSERKGMLLRDAYMRYNKNEKQFELDGSIGSLFRWLERNLFVYSAFRYSPSATRHRMDGAQAWQRFSYFFHGETWYPVGDTPRFGILPLITGTVMIMLIAAAISLPIGLMTAVYLSEYASPRIRAVAKPTLELLAGIPTIVYGYFALITVTPALQMIVPHLQFYNQLSGGIVVGIMIIPMVASLSEDSLRAVPRALRDGAIALGATKFETSAKVVVPAALSGVTASFLLAISRAVGETMAVSLACGQQPKMLIRFLSGDWNSGDFEWIGFTPNEGGLTMTSAIVNVAKGDLPHGTSTYDSIFAVGMMLFLITLGMNIIAQVVLRRYRQVYQ